MKSKFIWVAVVIGISVFLINNHQEQASERAAKGAERERIQQEIRSVVSQIVARHNAVSDWEKILSKGERFRMSPILTIELEKLWQSANSILFVGAIKDVSSSGSETYAVLVEQSPYNMDYMFATELRLSLIAPRALIDSFLENNPQLFAGGGFEDGVAVIAKIHDISSSSERDVDGEPIEVKIGHGNLLEIVYAGDVFF